MNDVEAVLRAASNAADLDEATVRFLEVAEAEGLIDVAWADIDTPVGSLVVAATATGVVKIGLVPNDDVPERLAATVSPRIVRSPRRLDAVRRQLDEYFEGHRTTFDVDVD